MPSAAFTRRASRAGFTLIELLLVIVILATIVALIAPRLEAVTDAGAEDRMTRLIGGALLRAQDLAIRSGNPVALAFDLDARLLLVADDHPVALPSRGTIAIAEPGDAFQASGRVEASIDGDGFLPPLRIRIGNRPVLRVHSFTAELIDESAWGRGREQ